MLLMKKGNYMSNMTCFDEDLETHLKATPGTLPIDMNRKWKRVISEVSKPNKPS